MGIFGRKKNEDQKSFKCEYCNLKFDDKERMKRHVRKAHNEMFPIHDDTERIHGRPYVNYSLIAINVIVFVWEVIATGYFSDQQAVAEIFTNYGAIPIRILNGDLLSILTSMFLHGGIPHLIGNMVFLFVFGDNIEDRFGHMKYLLTYIVWGATAAVIHSIFAVSAGGG